MIHHYSIKATRTCSARRGAVKRVCVGQWSVLRQQISRARVRATTCMLAMLHTCERPVPSYRAGTRTRMTMQHTQTTHRPGRCLARHRRKAERRQASCCGSLRASSCARTHAHAHTHTHKHTIHTTRTHAHLGNLLLEGLNAGFFFASAGLGSRTLVLFLVLCNPR